MCEALACVRASLTLCVKVWFVFVCLLHCLSKFGLCYCVSYIMCQGLFYFIMTPSRGFLHLMSSVGLCAYVSNTKSQVLVCVRVYLTLCVMC